MKINSIILGLAWRNLWKNKRRSALTLVSVVLGSSMILFMNALQKGGNEQTIEDAASANTAHIQIHEKGFWENSGIEYAFIPSERLARKLAGLKAQGSIKSFSKRLHAEGLISFRNKTSGASIQAADPENERQVTGIHEKILAGGRPLKPGDRKHVILGRDLAKYLGVAAGDAVSMISQGFDGSIAAENLVITGLFYTGDAELDRYLAIMPMAQAAETFSMMGHVNSIAIRLKRSDDIPAVLGALRASVDPKEIEVMDCYELLPELMQHMDMDRYPALVFNFILLMIASFGILNTIQMSVFERTREFGIMLAIGTRPAQVTSMVLCESAFITAIGVLAGIAVGSLAIYYFIINPISYSGMGDELTVYGMSPTYSYSPRLTALNLAVTAAVVTGTSLIFSMLPALKAGRIKPIHAMRQL